MASNVPNHTVRNVAGQVGHALFPSRRAALLALAVEVAALVMQLPPAAHVVVAIVVHVAIALARDRRVTAGGSGPRRPDMPGRLRLSIPQLTGHVE